MMDEKRKIEFRDGTYVVFGKEIGVRDGMYCLSDLLDILDEEGIKHQEWSVFARSRAFLDAFHGTSGLALDSDYVVSRLCSIGHYKRVGRGDSCRIFVSREVFVATLVRYTPELFSASMGLIGVGIKKR